MPKIAPKQTAKETATPGVKEKEKAAHAALIAKCVPKIAKLIEESEEIQKKAGAKFLEISDTVRSLKDEHDFSEADCRNLVKLALASAHEIEPDDVAKNVVLNTNLSKVMRLVFPVDEKVYFAQREKLQKQGGDYTVADALNIARKGKEAVAKGAGSKISKKGGNGGKPAGPKLLETADEFKDAVSPIIRQAMDGGQDLDEIAEAFTELVAEYAAEQEKE